MRKLTSPNRDDEPRLWPEFLVGALREINRSLESYLEQLRSASERAQAS